MKSTINQFFQALFILLIAFGSFNANAQDPSSILDLESTSQGLLAPRMTTVERAAIVTPAQSLMVYDTDTKSFWYYKDTSWNELGVGAASPWLAAGASIYFNTGNVAIGTTPNSNRFLVEGPIRFQQTGSRTFYMPGWFPSAAKQVIAGVFTGEGVNAPVIRYYAPNGNFTDVGVDTLGNHILELNDITRMTVLQNGNVGIGTTTPAAKLDVVGQIKATTSAGLTGLNLSESDSYADLRVIRNTLNSSDNDLYLNFGAPIGSKLHLYSDGVETMTVSGNQILVGTSIGATGYKVSVDGKIACEEVLVDLNGDWPDYVFNADYELKTLHEVKQYIAEKGHLPGVPSAQEIEENGIVLGEMNKVLMEKIEELTLYILQQEEKHEVLRSQMLEQQIKINTQDERLQVLESNKK